MNEPSAPILDDNIQFQQNLYPEIILPEFDMNNYRINNIMNQYKFLDEERKIRNYLKNKYVKLSNACFGTEIFITVSELGTVGTSIALPVIIPFSLPLSVRLTTCATILRSTSGFITKKINKHSEIDLLAKSK